MKKIISLVIISMVTLSFSMSHKRSASPARQHSLIEIGVAKILISLNKPKMARTALEETPFSSSKQYTALLQRIKEAKTAHADPALMQQLEQHRVKIEERLKYSRAYSRTYYAKHVQGTYKREQKNETQRKWRAQKAKK